jgi:hypothetical protein
VVERKLNSYQFLSKALPFKIAVTDNPQNLFDEIFVGRPPLCIYELKIVLNEGGKNFETRVTYRLKAKFAYRRKLILRAGENKSEFNRR